MPQLYDRYFYVVVPRLYMEEDVNWENYCVEFRKEAALKGKNEEYCNTWLQYAKALFDKGLPIIYNQEHLCLLLGYKEEYVFAVSNSASNFYRIMKYLKRTVGSEKYQNHCQV